MEKLAGYTDEMQEKLAAMRQTTLEKLSRDFTANADLPPAARPAKTTSTGAPNLFTQKKTYLHRAVKPSRFGAKGPGGTTWGLTNKSIGGPQTTKPPAQQLIDLTRP